MDSLLKTLLHLPHHNSSNRPSKIQELIALNTFKQLLEIMISSSNGTPIEQALHLAQIELIKSRQQNKNDSVDEEEDDVDNTIVESKVIPRNKEMSEYEIDETRSHDYFNYQQQPKNEIPYGDWVQLFPDLDLLHGNFRNVIEKIKRERSKHGENTNQNTDDGLVDDDTEKDDNKFQISNELAKIMEC